MLLFFGLKLIFFSCSSLGYPEACGSVVELWQQAEREGQTGFLLQWQPAVWLLLAFTALPKGTEQGLQAGHRKLHSLHTDPGRANTASYCTVPMSLVTDICKCSLTHAAYTPTVQHIKDVHA